MGNFFVLDKVDKRIIAALEKDSRQPNKAIAKSAGVNEHVVAYRIQRLMDQDVIRKIYCIINRGALFPIGYRVFLRFQNISTEKEAALVKRFADCKFTNWIGHCRGHWDVIVTFFANNPRHFMDSYNEITSGFEDFIQEREIGNYLEVIDCNRAYLYGGQPREMTEYSGLFRQVTVDDLDHKILEQLSTNSRRTSIEMADNFGVSPDTIRNRIKRLEKEKVILGHGVLLNLKKIGYNYYNLLLNLKNLSVEKEKALRNFSMQHPNILFWIRTIGAYDLHVEIEAEEEKLDKIIEELRNKFGESIKNLEVVQVIKHMKYTYVTQG